MARRVIEVFRAGRVGADGLSNLIGVVTTGVDAAVLNEDSGKAYRCTAALTLTLPAATSPGWSVIVDADGGDVTLASSMTVNGSASIVLSDGNSCLIYSDGSALFARFYYSDEISSSYLTAFAGIDPASLAARSGATFTGGVTIPTLTLTNDLPVTHGGTGASTTPQARINLGALKLFTGRISVSNGINTPIQNTFNTPLFVTFSAEGNSGAVVELRVASSAALTQAVSSVSFTATPSRATVQAFVQSGHWWGYYVTAGTLNSAVAFGDKGES